MILATALAVGVAFGWKLRPIWLFLASLVTAVCATTLANTPSLLHAGIAVALALFALQLGYFLSLLLRSRRPRGEDIEEFHRNRDSRTASNY